MRVHGVQRIFGISGNKKERKKAAQKRYTLLGSIFLERGNMLRRHLIFTDKKENKKGIFSAVLGLISMTGICVAVYQTFLNQGVAFVRGGVSFLLALIFSIAGLVFGIMGKMDKDSFHLLSWVGIILNLLVLACISFTLYAGAYGL